ncbi:MAG: hypothetical protein C4291_06655 [Candidatus Dadabacteria bacterium]
MVEGDIEFIRKVLRLNLLQSPCLEVGAAIEEQNAKKLILEAGLEYLGADIKPAPSIDFVVDFEDSKGVSEKFNGKRVRSILILNVLEHVFDPIGFLDNAFSILENKGTCVIIAPSVWPLHNFPYDFWRINPDFYIQYVKRRNLEIIDSLFEYIGFCNVKENMVASNEYNLPPPSLSKFKTLWSRAIHKFFNTYGRSMCFPPHVGVGVVIRKP